MAEIDNTRFKEAINRWSEQFEIAHPVYTGEYVSKNADGTNVVDMLRPDGTLGQRLDAVVGRVRAWPGVHVRLSRDRKLYGEDVWAIMGVDQTGYGTAAPPILLELHGGDHGYQQPDQIWNLHPRQIYPMRTEVSSGLVVKTQKGEYFSGGLIRALAADTTTDVTSQVGALSAGEKQYLTLSIDDAGSITVTSGVVLSDPQPTDIPMPPTGEVMVGTILIYQGMTTIVEADLKSDPRYLPGISGGGGGGGSGAVIWDNVLDVAKGGGQYSVIQSAINAASGANQAAWVMPGNYAENLFADHPDLLIRGSMALSRRSGPNTGARVSGTDDAGPLLSIQEDTTVVSINFKKTLALGSGLYTGILADDSDYALKLSESRVIIDDGALGRNVTCIKVTGNVTDSVRSIISRCVIEPTSTGTAKAVDLAGGVVLIEYSDIEGDIVSAAATDLYLEYTSVDGDVTGTGAGDLYLTGSYVSGTISGWNSVTYRGSLTDHTHSIAGDGGALAMGTTDTDGTATRVVFLDTGGVLQEDANFTWSGTLLKVGGAGEIEAATLSNTGLILQTTDDDATNPLLDVQDSAGTMLSEWQAPGNLNFATATAANPGMIEVNDTRFLHTYGTDNLFLGPNAGNFTLTGDKNLGLGYQTLDALTSGVENIAIGYNVLTSNTDGRNNVGIGLSALRDNTSGQYNVGIGSNALIQNTTASYNVAIGASALFTNTTGASNIAIGFSALRLNTTGLNNVAIGESPLYSNTVGDYNVGIGSSVLRLNTTGAFNTAIGQSSLYANLTGGYNVGIGGLALRDNTLSFNVGIGHHALRYQTSGQSNVGIGAYAGRSNVTGDDNVCVGYRAGYGVTANSNQQNVFIGKSSGDAITTGDNNVCVGYHAGDVLTTGGNNIIIGHDVDPSGATVSDELNIGDLLKGYLSAHASGPAIHFMGGTPQAQQAHIVDADGTLADVTTKVNTLLAALEGYGLLASA